MDSPHTPIYAQDTLPAYEGDTPPLTPAARRAWLAAYIPTWTTLPAFVQAAAGVLSIVPVCNPTASGCDCAWHAEQHGGHCPSPGKTPRVKWKLWQTEVPPAALVRRWARQWPHSNWMVVTGPINGLLVLDKDAPDAEALDLEPTLRVLTGRDGGCHDWLAYPADAEIHNDVDRRLPGWDVRGLGGLAALPGNRHPTGRCYALDPASVGHGMAPLPDAIRARLTSAPPRIRRDGTPTAVTASALLDGLPAGQRDDALWRWACSLRNADVPLPWAVELVERAARAAQPPYPEDLATEKVYRAYEQPVAHAPRADDSATVLRLRAQCDQLAAANADLLARNVELDREVRELKRQNGPEAVRRALRAMADWQRDRSTRCVAPVALALYLDHADAVAHGQPADTGILWSFEERATALQLDPKTQRKALDLLKGKRPDDDQEGEPVVTASYEALGKPSDGDYRQRVRFHFTKPLPDDPADALDTMRRTVQHQRPRKPYTKQPSRAHKPCDCRDVQCVPGCHAPHEHEVAVFCTLHGQLSAYHGHAPRQPSRRPAPAVMHLRPAPSASWAASEGKNSRLTLLETNHGNFSPDSALAAHAAPPPARPTPTTVEAGLALVARLRDRPLPDTWGPLARSTFEAGVVAGVSEALALPLAAGGSE